ncbi:MAG: hypothetical protein ABW252_06940 [Polyangiales bacterium]
MVLLILPALSLACFEDEPSDGQVDASEKPGSRGDDGGVLHDVLQPDAATACDESHACTGDAVCAAGACVPRCDAQGICAVITAPRRISDLAVASDALYYALEPSRDVLGNTLDDAQIWVQPASGTPTLLRDGLEGPRAHLLVDGDYLYWHEADKLQRAPRSAPTEVEALYETDCGIALPLPEGQLAVQSSGGLFVGSRDGTATLRKISEARGPLQEGESDSQVVACVPLYHAYGRIFRVRHQPVPNGAWPSALVATDLTGAEETVHARVYGPDSILAVAPPYYWEINFFTGYSITRSKLGGNREDDKLVVRLDSAYNVRAHAHGAWIYLANPSYPVTATVALSRNALNPPVKIETLSAPESVRVPTDGYVPFVTATSDAMYVVIAATSGSVVQRVPLRAN